MGRSFHHLVPLENDPVERSPHCELTLLILLMPRPTKKTRSRHSTRSKRRPRPRSYTPVSDALKQPFSFADSELAEGISRHGLVGLLARALSRKRRRDGEPLGNVLCALLTWPLLGVHSIHCLCAQLCQILQGQLSVLYDFLGREDICWRGLSTQVSRRLIQQNDLGARRHRAFVVDDAVKARAGRKVEGTSSHFDHTEGKTIRGHQFLQLGLASKQGFVPVEGQIVMSDVNAVVKPKD